MEGKRSFLGEKDNQVLLEMLYFVMGKMQAKKLTKELLDTFGSYWGVLEAPESELMMVNSMDKHTAEYIASLQAAAVYYLENSNTGIKRIYDTETACDVLKPRFLGRKREAVALLLLDGRGRVLFNGIVNEGSVSEVPIYIRRVVELCLKYDAYTAIIAHNHPSGNPAPSRNDLNATRDVTFALNGIDVDLMDHIIFAGGDYTSLKSSEWLEKLEEEVKAYKQGLRHESMEQEETLFHE